MTVNLPKNEQERITNAAIDALVESQYFVKFAAKMLENKKNTPPVVAWWFHGPGEPAPPFADKNGNGNGFVARIAGNEIRGKGLAVIGALCAAAVIVIAAWRLIPQRSASPSGSYWWAVVDAADSAKGLHNTRKEAREQRQDEWRVLKVKEEK